MRSRRGGVVPEPLGRAGGGDHLQGHHGDRGGL